MGTNLPAPAEVRSSHRHGGTVAWLGDRLLVGVDGRRDGPPDPGLVVVFERSNRDIGPWKPTLILRSPESEAGDEFGASLAVDDRWLVVGAPGADDQRGRVWAYEIDRLREDHHHPHHPHRAPIIGRPGDRIGDVVAAGGGLLIAAAPRADVDGRIDRGRAWIWNPDHDGQTVLELLPADSETGLRFGAAAAIGETVAIGSPGADVRPVMFTPDNRVDRAGRVDLFALGPPHARIGSRHRHPPGPLDRTGSSVAWSARGLVVGTPRAACGPGRGGLVTLFGSPVRESTMPCHPDGHAGERLATGGDWLVATIPGRRGVDGRLDAGIRIWNLRPDELRPIADLVGLGAGAVLDVAISTCGEWLAIGASRHHEDESTTGEVWVVALEAAPSAGGAEPDG